MEAFQLMAKLKCVMLLLLAVLIITVPAVSANENLNEDSLMEISSSDNSMSSIQTISDNYYPEEEKVSSLNDVSSLDTSSINSIYSSSSVGLDTNTDDEDNTQVFSSLSKGITNNEDLSSEDSTLYSNINNDENVSIIESLSTKADSTIIYIGEESFLYNETLDFEITINPALDTTVDATLVNNEANWSKDFTFSVVDGVVQYDFGDESLIPGEYELTISYGGNGDYDPVKETFIFNIEKISTNMEITFDKDEYFYSDYVTVYINLNEDVEGPGKAVVDGVPIDIYFTNGQASLIVSWASAGEHAILVNFFGSDIYTASSNSATFSVAKKQSSITVDGNYVYYYGDNLDFSISINPAFDGFVDVNIYGEYANLNKTYSFPVVNGVVQYDFSDLDLTSDVYEITVFYDGDEYYSSISKTFEITIMNECQHCVDVKVIPVDNDSVIIIIDSEDDSNGVINFNIDGESSNHNLVNGEASFVIDDLDDCCHNYNLTYTNEDTGVSDFVEGSFTIEGSPTFESDKVTLNAQNTTLYYKDGTAFEVALTSNKQPVADKTVTIVINGVSYSKTTNDAGIAKITINLSPGTYSVTVRYGNQSITRTVTVLSTLVSEDLTKYYRNSSQYSVLVLDKDGNPLVNKNVVFNIHGVFYNKVTNNQGIATLNINLSPGKYIITAIGPDGLMRSNNVVVLPTIIVEDLTKYYQNGSQYRIKVVDGQGNPVAGREVAININGVFYYKTTDKTGVAILSINLAPKTYIATVQDLTTGLMVSSTVKVLPVIRGEDLSMTFKDGSNYEVKLVDNTGRPLVGETVIMNVNGVLYSKITDANGIASLNINLLPGKYVITASHGTAVTSNIISVKEN